MAVDPPSKPTSGAWSPCVPSQCTYITGGGQRRAVTDRVAIYEREGGVTAEARPERYIHYYKYVTPTLTSLALTSTPRFQKKQKRSVNILTNPSNDSPPASKRSPKTGSSAFKTAKTVKSAKPTAVTVSKIVPATSTRQVTPRASTQKGELLSLPPPLPSTSPAVAVANEIFTPLQLFPVDWSEAQSYLQVWSASASISVATVGPDQPHPNNEID